MVCARMRIAYAALKFRRVAQQYWSTNFIGSVSPDHPSRAVLIRTGLGLSDHGVAALVVQGGAPPEIPEVTSTF